jgi:uncharacterized membrane protein
VPNARQGWRDIRCNLNIGEVQSRGRVASIDALRGMVMVLMVLDHARDFFVGFNVNTTNLAITTPPLFFTRWVTHFCAPVFVFLAGVSAYLYGERHGKPRLSRFLLTRGLWLIVLEVTIVRFAWTPDPFYRVTLLQVIWVIGWAMTILAALCRLPIVATIALGSVLVAGHDTLNGIHAGQLGSLGWTWTLLHERGVLEPWAGHRFLIAYPLLPWIGVIALGYGFGTVFDKPPEERRRTILRFGLVATAGFGALRLANVYGDPVPWSSNGGTLWAVLSFLNCEKYPPSLLYLLMTLGPALCVLAVLPDEKTRPLVAKLVTFGSVPLFFYVAHLHLLRWTSLPLGVARWGAAAFTPPPAGHAGSPELSLWSAYLASALACAILYRPCRWFAELKARRKDWWIGYL